MSNQPPPLPGADKHGKRWQWRVCFWLFFLLTPVVSMLAMDIRDWLPKVWPGALPGFMAALVSMNELVAIATFGIGALCAGYCIAKLHTKQQTALGLALCSFAFGAGLVAVYFAVAFVGCIIAVSKSGI